MSKIDPKDGVSLINIYSQSTNELGRLLSNFAMVQLLLPEGLFNSVEAYWYYLCINDAPEKEKIKDKIGAEAKEFGEYLISQYGEKEWDYDLFKEKIIFALRLKVKNHVRLRMLLKESTLPFDHYYYYNGKKVGLNQYKWFSQAYEDIREEVKKGLL